MIRPEPLAATAGPPPGRTSSRVPIRVRFGETDLMAIAHHGSYLLWFEEARVEYLRRRGSLYGDWVARGIHLPVIDVRIRYRAPAKFDDALVVETWIGEVSRVAVRFDDRVLRDDKVIAEGYTTLACVDDRHRPTRVPQDVVDQVMRDETP